MCERLTDDSYILQEREHKEHYDSGGVSWCQSSILSTPEISSSFVFYKYSKNGLLHALTNLTKNNVYMVVLACNLNFNLPKEEKLKK